MKRLVVAGLVLAPSIASAHIHLTSPISRTDLPTGDQKAQHCGVAGYVRADHPDRISTFAPGSTITVTWAETIQHTGWFRIAFQPNGEVFGIPPAGNGPPANFPNEDRTGMTDPANQSIVLADRIPDGTLSKEITLPNIECANCTLQFIQVMTDSATYDGAGDIYFNCADITLSAAAPDAGTGPGVDAGTTPGGDAGTGGNNNGGTVDGGCSTSAASGGSSAVVLVFLGLAWTRRRRARA
ncbi:MAG: lytic polysaccharide monooxygenase [Deltaproteobacteria bacterium]|nr:lytic polysaccharide monooxygenase [Deltaproteobacteria bacterium]